MRSSLSDVKLRVMWRNREGGRKREKQRGRKRERETESERVRDHKYGPATEGKKRRVERGWKIEEERSLSARGREQRERKREKGETQRRPELGWFLHLALSPCLNHPSERVPFLARGGQSTGHPSR